MSVLDKFTELIGGSKPEADPMALGCVINRDARVGRGVFATLSVGMKEGEFLPTPLQQDLQQNSAEATTTLDPIASTAEQATGPELIIDTDEASALSPQRRAGELVLMDAERDRRIAAANAGLDNVFKEAA